MLAEALAIEVAAAAADGSCGEGDAPWSSLFSNVSMKDCSMDAASERDTPCEDFIFSILGGSSILSGCVVRYVAVAYSAMLLMVLKQQ